MIRPEMFETFQGELDLLVKDLMSRGLSVEVISEISALGELRVEGFHHLSESQDSIADTMGLEPMISDTGAGRLVHPVRDKLVAKVPRDVRGIGTNIEEARCFECDVSIRPLAWCRLVIVDAWPLCVMERVTVYMPQMICALNIQTLAASYDGQLGKALDGERVAYDYGGT